MVSKKINKSINKPEVKNKNEVDFSFFTKPMSHQLEAFNLSKDKEYFGLFMEMGTGKSKVIVDTICYLFLQNKINAAVILAPSDMYFQWCSIQNSEWFIHANEWVYNNTEIFQWDGRNTKKEKEEQNKFINLPTDKLKLLVINHESVSKRVIEKKNKKLKGYLFLDDFIKNHKCITIVDESTAIKNYQSKRTKAILTIGENSEYRRILTGTPITNSLLDIYPQIYFLNPEVLGKSYTAFKSKHCLYKEIYVAKNTKRKVIAGYRRGKRIRDKIDSFCYRVLKEDCLDLEPKIYLKREVPLGKEQEKIYNKLREEMFYELENEEIITVDIILTKILRLQQILCGFVKPDNTEEIYNIKDDNRLNFILSLIEQLYDKVIVFCVFKHNAHMLVNNLSKLYGKKSTIKFTGDTKNKSELEHEFNTNKEKRFFIATTGHRGLNLQNCHQTIYYTNHFSVDKRKQSEDRTHRKNQENKCSYFDFYTPDTIEEKIYFSLRKNNDLARLITGDKWKEWI